jgi:hypothetical protein
MAKTFEILKPFQVPSIYKLLAAGKPLRKEKLSPRDFYSAKYLSSVTNTQLAYLTLSVAYSGASHPLIPIEVIHPFRGKSSSDSESKASSNSDAKASTFWGLSE